MFSLSLSNLFRGQRLGLVISHNQQIERITMVDLNDLSPNLAGSI